MFNNHKIKGYLFLFLAFCVLSSKSIIIYNEETLVALSFYTFVLFCFHYFGNTVKESLDERTSTIKGELQNFLHYKEQSLLELSQEHKRISELKSILPSIGAFTEKQLSMLSSSGGRTLNMTFVQELQQKLGSLSSSKSTLQQRLQRLIASNIQALVLNRIEQSSKPGKQDHLDTKMIQKSIQLLRS